MVDYEQSTPYVLLFSTLALELLAFMTSHMVDSRNFSTLHEGLFKRCIYPIKDPSLVGDNQFSCLWWSADTFSADRASLQFVTIAAFLSIFLIGFTALFSIFTYYYPELRTQAYKTGMTTANVINVILLLLIAIVYTFVYAGDTKLIPGVSSPLVFSWSYYLLFAALGTNVLSTIFFLYYPQGDSK